MEAIIVAVIICAYLVAREVIWKRNVEAYVVAVCGEIRAQSMRGERSANALERIADACEELAVEAERANDAPTVLNVFEAEEAKQDEADARIKAANAGEPT